VTAVLELDDVTVQSGERTLLADVSLAVGEGERVGLVGPSGAGKTTLLRVALGLVTPTAGVVRLGGREASRGGRALVPPEDRRLAVVFQDLALWPHLGVRGNLAFVLRARGVPRRQHEGKIAAALSAVGLGGPSLGDLGTLSGGELQRLALARALVQEPAAMLLDEPFASLDVASKSAMLTVVRGALDARRLPCLFVTHDPLEAAQLASRLVVLEAGRVVFDGTPAALQRDPPTDFVRAFARAMPVGA
jgi:ABC-type Fe3+/spermidine/putrescine transport system ATPase subunit